MPSSPRIARSFSTRSNLSLSLLLHNPEEATSKLPSAAARHAFLEESFGALAPFLGNDSSATPLTATGVCSNGLSLPSSHPLSISLSSLPLPPSSTVLLPLNLLESSSLPLPSSPAFAGLNHTIIGTRPLTPHPDGGAGDSHPFKLLDYELTAPDSSKTSTHLLPPGYVEPSYRPALALALGHFDADSLADRVASGEKLSEEEEGTLEGAGILQGLLKRVDGELKSLRSMAAYDAMLAKEIVPVIQSTFEELDEETSTLLSSYFAASGSSARILTAQRTRTLVTSGGDGGGDTVKHAVPEGMAMQEYAIRWAMEREGVGGVSVGMPRVEIVEEFLGGG